MELILPIGIFIVAYLYASVGHGGASGYLAIMGLLSFSPETMRPTALILNCVVSLIAFYQFYRSGHFSWNLFWPFAFTSIPAAYMGGLIHLDDQVYKKMLAVILLFSVYRLVMPQKASSHELVKPQWPVALCIGALIGMLSGMIGIGGGILLSPLMLLFRWADVKETAGISALFIFVNSLAGLMGLASKALIWPSQPFLLLIPALVGGSIGAYYGAFRWDKFFIKRILAFVMLIACIKLWLI